MTGHEMVDSFEEKPLPDSEEMGIRIPLSLGTVREDNDKAGNIAQVYDVIWNPTTIARCKKEAGFRQIAAELVFTYIKQKYTHTLNPRFTVPKMNYKGKTVQLQRVRAKKGPKIQQIESK